MDQIVQQISIQFPTLPEILALVNSTFALLLTVGFIFKAFSQQEILQDFFKVFLQTMYQENYQEILKERNLIQQNQCTQVEENSNQNQAEQNIQEKDVSDNISLPEFSTKFRNYLEQGSQTQHKEVKIYNKQDEIIENQKDKIIENQKDNMVCEFYLSSIETQIEKINSTQNEQLQGPKLNKSQITFIQDRSLCQNIQNKTNKINLKRPHIDQNSKIKSYKFFESTFRAIQDTNLFNKVKKFMFQKRQAYKIPKKLQQLMQFISSLFKKKNADNHQTYQSLSLIRKQINKQLNILDFYKDMLFIKKSIMMLLSKEQLAAIQLIGYSCQYVTDEFNKQKNENLRNKKCKNYFEEQQDILNSCDLKCKYIKKFFKNNSQDNFKKNDINHRILSSIQYKNV
ncbi:AMP-binding enzyme family protein (macronuclear) [Tetrahymena thermophila SB210]|uniref:AMP-binding enzyme family protein n=1 Tax=Tetrahymena thermophila (strain SB210) TaxID=312017 RepID=W7XI93_TETTS|nr:AMP-binding enzyme family protein [Tetrahymena thermophila SB210]EWS74426.1 AMP-binding enzyme family protein [Tetrahymena thermophila SB210]|eukprot:XP_012653003.1 AMP-binding enzyme family protein [Tetrahymena thermophila SB210]